MQQSPRIDKTYVASTQEKYGMSVMGAREDGGGSGALRVGWGQRST